MVPATRSSMLSLTLFVCSYTGEERQARGGCVADLVLTGEARGEQLGSFLYTFTTAASLRAGMTQATPAPTQPTQQVRLSSKLFEHRTIISAQSCQSRCASVSLNGSLITDLVVPQYSAHSLCQPQLVCPCRRCCRRASTRGSWWC